MEELLDVFDETGKHVGVKSRSFCHSENPGVYHKAVWIWIKNLNNQILVQKRALTKKKSPGKWDMPSAGHVDAGETPISTCVRETKEELGLNVSENDFVFLREFVNHHGWEFAQVYLLTTAATKNEIKVQPEEVADVKWLNYNEFIDLLYSDEFCAHNKEYKDWVAQVLK